VIKIFRNTRRALLAQKRLSKYLLYAIGEILLVVIGILIALKINNANALRKEHSEERILLQQLHSEFQSNLKQLDQKIALRDDIMGSAKALLGFIDNADIRNKDTIDYLIARSLPYATFDPIENDLATSGELRLIRDNAL
jgi:hypothetical protein